MFLADRAQIAEWGDHGGEPTLLGDHAGQRRVGGATLPEQRISGQFAKRSADAANRLADGDRDTERAGEGTAQVLQCQGWILGTFQKCPGE